MRPSSFCILFIFTCLSLFSAPAKETMPNDEQNMTKSTIPDFALIGGGCFWCTEAVFEKIDGVLEVISGYAGGALPNPTYKDICTGQTGHAEVIKIKFLPHILSYAEILEIFGKAHDPTTLNRQGADVGTQYRSTIMYYNKEQEKVARSGKTSFPAHLLILLLLKLCLHLTSIQPKNIIRIITPKIQTKVIVRL